VTWREKKSKSLKVNSAVTLIFFGLKKLLFETVVIKPGVCVPPSQLQMNVDLHVQIFNCARPFDNRAPQKN